MFDAKAHYVRRLFSSVPTEYDLLLELMTFRQDKRWRSLVVETARPERDIDVLDIATGTGLLAANFASAARGNGTVVGVDLTFAMLQTAKRRLRDNGLGDRVSWVLARAENLPFRDNCFASASISLALRNVSDASSTIREMVRVTKPGGTVISLDFARPTNTVFKILYYDYLLGILPVLGRLVSREWGRTLSYLGRSILQSRTGEQIALLMRRQGLGDASSVPLTMGIVCAVYGKKDEKKRLYENAIQNSRSV